MNAERLLAHYEKIADAPDAIPRLRRFVLDLAVRGKLVPQDQNDEPAQSRMRASSSADGPFGLPFSWVWVNVGSVADTRLGKMLDKVKNKGIPRPYLRNINVRWFDFDLSDLLQMLFEEEELTELALRAGDVMICEGGEPGRAAVWDQRADNVYFQKAIHRVRFNPIVDPAFFVKALRASADDGRLAEYFTGTGIKHFTGKSLNTYLFPLPPLTEQHRIVAKVDELMALCDRLEAARAEREATRDRLTAASLARLSATDPDTFSGDARFALDALPALTARPDQIKQLRQTILNLAVRGKLVPRDPNDESASVQIARVADAKSVGKGRKGARAKGLPNNADRSDESLPTGWTSVRLDDLAISMHYGTSIKCGYDADQTPVLRIPNVSSGRVVLDDLKYGPLSDRDREALTLEAGDLLMIRSNGSLDIVGRSAVVTPEAEGMAFAGYLVRLHTLKDQTDTRYIWLALNSGSVREQIEHPIRSAVGLKNVNLTEFGNLSFWLPPLAEQHRIVAKVDELMALCDRLEASLTTADETRRRLLESLLAEALAPDEERELEAAE